jgi:hypothetical protein
MIVLNLSSTMRLKEPMKFCIRTMLLPLVLFSIGCEPKTTTDSFPDYRLIKRFSKRLNKEAGAVLYCYGTSPHQSEWDIQRYGKSTFDVTYFFIKSQKDLVSLEEARCTLVSVAESFLEEINTDPEVKPSLDVYPLTYDWIKLYINFKDENKADLENGGISIIYFSGGRIRYETVEDPEGKPSKRRISTYYEEPYEKALEIVKEQGCLKDY